MLQGEHSAILSAFIKLPFVIKIFVLSIFEWVFYTGFTVYNLYIKISPSFENREEQLEPWWVSMPFVYYFIIACGLILNVHVYLATFSVNSMPGI